MMSGMIDTEAAGLNTPNREHTQPRERVYDMTTPEPLYLNPGADRARALATLVASAARLPGVWDVQVFIEHGSRFDGARIEARATARISAGCVLDDKAATGGAGEASILQAVGLELGRMIREAHDAITPERAALAAIIEANDRPSMNGWQHDVDAAIEAAREALR
jgi:hypothetical protein